MISVDTLRADRLTCFAHARPSTPNIDTVAIAGTRFSQISSQVPLTFPSHFSLFTSTLPFSSGVLENGQSFPPGLFTLATILKAHGYTTAAFIGGFPLDERFGLNQGFDHYDGRFGSLMEPEKGRTRRPAEEVTQAAMDWLGRHAEEPFFLFLHLYDLHTPYKLTPAQQARYGGNNYDAELRYVDETLGRFWAFLEAQGLADRALIVFLSDHGEGLMDHGEPDHGFLLYQTTLHVPLIIHWPRKTGYGIRDTGDGKIETGNGPSDNRKSTIENRQSTTGDWRAVVNDPASLLDVAPTILQFLGIPAPAQFQGRSLLGLARGETSSEDREVYSETTYPRHIGGAPLRSLRVGRYKYIDAPEPELYDLSLDPHELNNLCPRQTSLALALNGRMHSLRLRYGAVKPVQSATISPEAVARLSALGYLAFSEPSQADSPSGADLKKLLPAYAQTRHAIELAQAGNLRQAAALLEQLLAADPDLTDTRSALATVEEKMGQHQRAADDFRIILRKDPLNALAHYDLAVSEFHLRHFDEASKELAAVQALAAAQGPSAQAISAAAQDLLAAIRRAQGLNTK